MPQRATNGYVNIKGVDLFCSSMIGDMLNLRQMVGGRLVLAGYFMVTLAH